MGRAGRGGGRGGCWQKGKGEDRKRERRKRGGVKVRAKTRVERKQRGGRESNLGRTGVSETTRAPFLFFCPSQESTIESRIVSAPRGKQNEGLW